MNDDIPSDSIEDHELEQAKQRRRKIRENATPEKSRKLPLVSILVSILFLACVGAFSFIFVMPQKVVNQWPEAAAFYEKVGIFIYPESFKPKPDIEIRPYASSMVVEGDVYKLAVSGNIINRGQHSVVIPQIVGTLLNASGTQIYTWMFCLPNRVLVRGQSVDYKYELFAAPDSTATAVVEIKWQRDADGEVIDTCPALDS